ncbi:MAG: DUF4139 domain-containing protein [Bacteroidetes bacterium]|nr:DUF4139 domain-containing protein [Fibrella sp.]
MKYSLFFCLIFTRLNPLLAQTGSDERRVSATLRQVTVFLNRAQLSAQATATLDAGTTRFIIDNVPASTDPQSIQVSGKGDAVIQGVQFRTNYITQSTKPASLQRLDDSLKTNREALELLTLQKTVLTDERNLLLANQKIGGTNGTTVLELEKMAALFQKRLTDLGMKLLKTDRQLTEQAKRVARLEAQVKEQNARREQPVGEIEVTLTARSRTPIELDLNYVVNDAGWQPVYDIRIGDTRKPASLAYKAFVYQKTGFDWENIRLVLSTANPALGGTQPELSPQYTGFSEPLGSSGTGLNEVVVVARVKREMKQESPTDGFAAAGAAPVLDNTADFVQTLDQPTNVAFTIAIPYTILSNRPGAPSRPQLVDIQTADIAATYRYEATPKLDADAFLTAQLTGWEKLNLLNGAARIYFEGTYVGESQISLANAKDTITVGLGRDKRVVVKREKIEDVSNRKTVGSNIREMHSYRITVRNTRAEPVSLNLYDQIPVSTDNRIEISPEDLAGADRNAETVKLTWRLLLKPGESRVLTFRYEVKYPKGKTLTNAD